MFLTPRKLGQWVCAITTDNTALNIPADWKKLPCKKWTCHQCFIHWISMTLPYMVPVTFPWLPQQQVHRNFVSTRSYIELNEFSENAHKSVNIARFSNPKLVFSSLTSIVSCHMLRFLIHRVKHYWKLLRKFSSSFYSAWLFWSQWGHGTALTENTWTGWLDCTRNRPSHPKQTMSRYVLCDYLWWIIYMEVKCVKY